MSVPDFVNGKPRAYSKYLSDKHHAIIRLRVAGMSNKEIAQTLGFDASHVGQVCSSDLGRAEIERLKNQAATDIIEVSKRIQELLPDAVSVLKDNLDMDGSYGVKPELRLKTAQDILNRSGIVPVKKVEKRSVNVMTVEAIERLKDRARAVGVSVEAEAEITSG